MIVKPGSGTGDITLGCSTKDIERTLGKPDSVSVYSDDVWWSFRNRGIDCCFSKEKNTVTALNFFRDGVSEHKKAQAITKEGLGPGSYRHTVLEHLGAPSESGKKWRDRYGKQHRAWISYSSGLAFEFGENDVVDIMTVFSAQKDKG
jgi:hypothetical protein